MKKAKQKNYITVNEQKYRAKMVKGKKGWLIKGMIFGTLLFGGMLANETFADAAVWAPNTVEQIASRISAEQKSITMVEGDTVYNIGLAINIKDPMQLLYDNGFKDGEQYTLPVGTVISWDGNHVTVTAPDGKVIGDGVVTDDQKHNPDQTIAGQATDVPQNQSNTRQVNNNKTATQTTTKPQTKVDDNTTKPETPDATEQSDNQTDLETLETKLQAAEQELATAQQNLEDAKTQADTNFDSEIAALQKTIAEKEANKPSVENEIADLTAKKNTANTELSNAQAALNTAVATQQPAQEAVLAAQSALDAITKTGNQEQITNAQTALQTAQDAYNTVAAQVAQAQNIVNEKQNAGAVIDSQITAKQAELANYDTSAEKTKLAELKAQRSQQNQQSTKALEQTVAEQQQAVDKLKAQITAAKLKSDRAQAVRTIKQFTYLAQTSAGQFAAKINNALTKEEIQSIVADAQAQNNQLKAQYQTEQAAKELQKAKAAAITKLGAMNLKNQLENFKSKVNTAAAIDAINTAVSEAKTISDENDKADADAAAKAAAEQALTQAKSEVLAKLNQLNLKAQKQSFIDQVNQAMTKEAVADLFVLAQTASKENDKADDTTKETEFSASKSAALKKLATFNLKDQQVGFESKITEASSIDDINTILDNAQTLSDTNDKADAESQTEAEQLESAKTKAQSKLEQMNLKEQKATFKNQVEQAETTTEINQIITNAQALSDKNDQADKDNNAEEQTPQALADAKSDLITKLNQMNLGNQKQAFVERVNNATKMDALASILNEAQTVSDSNDQADSQANGKQKLEDARTDAAAKLQKMNLDQNVQAYNERLANATTLDDIKIILSDAQETSDINDDNDQLAKEQEELEKVDEARISAQNEVYTLNLNGEGQTYIDKLDAAKTQAEITTIITDARALSAFNDKHQAEIQQNAQTLEDARAAAIELVNGYYTSDSTNSPNWIGKLADAKSLEEINQIVADATAYEKQSLINDDYGIIHVKIYDRLAHPMSELDVLCKSGNYELTLEDVAMDPLDYRIYAGNTTGRLDPGEKTSLALTVEKHVVTQLLDAKEQQNFKTELLKMINDLRASVGVGALVEDPTLEKVADIRSNDLPILYSHTRPDGSDWKNAYYRIMNDQYPQIYGVIGENLDKGASGMMTGKLAATYMFNAWKNSPDHYANMVRPEYDSIGIGIVSDRNCSYSANEFGDLRKNN